MLRSLRNRRCVAKVFRVTAANEPMLLDKLARLGPGIREQCKEVLGSQSIVLELSEQRFILMKLASARGPAKR
jgi:hypothetical protein